MNEHQIRNDLKLELPKLLNLPKNVRLVEEMEICGGKARADMAYIGEKLIGVEIKGPRDTLDRLPIQVKWYSRCFDLVVLVVHEDLVREAVKIVPKWWGILVGQEQLHTSATYRMLRRPLQNRRVETAEILGLLWRHEIETLYLHLLKQPPPQRASKRDMRETLIALSASTTLKFAGIELLLTREDWREDDLKAYPIKRAERHLA